jgi:DNA-binding transcriptional MerR regulator
MTNKITYTIVPTYSETSRGFVDLEMASQLSGMHPEMILEVTRAQLVVISRQDRSGNPYFDDEAIYRLRQIEELRMKQRMQMRTVRLIMQLRDRAEAAEREVRWLRERMR